MEKNTIISRIKCIDGTILTSTNRHDFVCHEIMGKRICLDGGRDYQRLVGDMELLAEDYDVSITTETPIEEIREVYDWGTYGKNGDEEYHRILLKDMTDGHLRSICETQSHIPEYVITAVFIAEIEYRFKKGITIEE